MTNKKITINEEKPMLKRKELLWEISCGSAINSAFKEKKEKKERKMKEKNHYYLRDTKLKEKGNVLELVQEYALAVGRLWILYRFENDLRLHGQPSNASFNNRDRAEERIPLDCRSRKEWN